MSGINESVEKEVLVKKALLNDTNDLLQAFKVHN